MNDLSKAVPAFTALFVILANAVAPIIPNAENLLVTVSTLLLRPLEPSVAFPKEEAKFPNLSPIFNFPIKPAIPFPAEEKALPNFVQILSV